MGVLVSGNVVEMSEGADGGWQFCVPSSRAAGLKDFSVYFEEMPILHACAFSDVCSAARTGDGVDHEKYKPFHR